MTMDVEFELDRDELVKVFTLEANEHLDAMEEGLVALESQPDDVETLATIFRGAHTVKGGALSLGFDGLGELAHAVENLLEKLRSHALAVRCDTVSLLLRSVDALRVELAAGLDGALALGPQHRAMLAELERQAAGGAEAASPTLTAPPEFQPRRHDDIAEERARTLRVDVNKLDRMLDLAGEAAVARGRLRQILERLGVGAASALEAHLEAERLSLDLQEMVMKVRMVPIGPSFRRFSRAVRDMAGSHGKLAHLIIEGEEVEVDTRVIEQLSDPLMHMVRNAIDHGIETPEKRRAAGKDESGTLLLKAYHEGSTVIIKLVDDGAGLSRERILSRALERGLIEEGARPGDAQLFELVFRPGFSTAETVSDLSGRGVGMDVVRRNIEALHGTVTLDSPLGQGTTVTIRLPLTLAIIRSFGVSVGDETYLIPIEHVVECVALPEADRLNRKPRGVISLREEPLPYLRFGNAGAVSREHVVVVRSGDERAGLVVDRLHGESQTVIKPLGAMFKEIPGVAGSAIQASGKVALILDVPGLLRENLRQQATVA